MIFGGIMVSAGNSYADSLYAGSGNRTDDTTENSRDSLYAGAGNRSLYAGAGDRSDDTTVSETSNNETTIQTLFSDIIVTIFG